MNESPIVTLHDISGGTVLVNTDNIIYIRQSETYCVIYMTDNIAVKVSETLNDIGKYLSAKTKIY